MATEAKRSRMNETPSHGISYMKMRCAENRLHDVINAINAGTDAPARANTAAIEKAMTGPAGRMRPAAVATRIALMPASLPRLRAIRSLGINLAINPAAIRAQISAARVEVKATFARMKAEEKAEQARIRAEEKAADHEFAEMLKRQEASQQEKTELQR